MILFGIKSYGPQILFKGLPMREKSLLKRRRLKYFMMTETFMSLLRQMIKSLIRLKEECRGGTILRATGLRFISTAILTNGQHFALWSMQLV